MSQKSILLNILEFSLCTLFVVFLLSNFVRFCNGADNLTFKRLLEILQESSNVQSISPIINLKIYSNWGVFNFLRDFLNFFTGSFSFIIWLSENLLNCIAFVLNFFFRLTFYSF